MLVWFRVAATRGCTFAYPADGSISLVASVMVVLFVQVLRLMSFFLVSPRVTAIQSFKAL